MSSPFTEQELKKIEAGDLKTIVQLDQRGFIPGASETLQEFTDRLRNFEKNLTEMAEELKTKKKLTIEKLEFPEEERIPQTAFNPAGKITEELYDFRINWVPGFFVNPDFGWFFGGCAYSFAPDFFSLFIIRSSFKKKKKWLIYERDELMSHELCHVARFAMGSHKYEEQFAYQTSTSNFRKNFGCMMRSAWETYIVMGLLFAMLTTQISLITLKGAWMAERTIFNNPVNWFYAVIFSFVSYLVIRQKRQNKDFAHSLELLKSLTDKPRALAFRMTDSELDHLATFKSLNSENFEEIINKSQPPSYRINFLRKRFFKEV
jgi:hypothetical protein